MLMFDTPSIVIKSNLKINSAKGFDSRSHGLTWVNKKKLKKIYLRFFI
jgi:hypothetical protein